MGIEWIIAGGVLAGGAAWAYLKRKAIIRRWWPVVKAHAREVWVVVEVLAALSPTTIDDKAIAYVNRLLSWAKANDVPIDPDEIERRARAWAEHWSEQEKIGADPYAEALKAKLASLATTAAREN